MLAMARLFGPLEFDFGPQRKDNKAEDILHLPGTNFGMAGGLSSLSDELDKLISFIDCITFFEIMYNLDSINQKRFSGVVYTVMEPAHSTGSECKV